MQKDVKLIIEENYKIGSVLTIEKIGSGLIHDTYRITASNGKFIFQKLHKSLSSHGISNDFYNITEHLATRECLAPAVIKTLSGKILCEDEGSVWRMQSDLGGNTHDRITTNSIAYEAGGMLAKFHNAMRDFEKPFESDFVLHNTQKELDALKLSLKNTSADLLTQEVSDIADQILRNAQKLLLPSDLPIWVIHGDPKVSNILFDKEKAIAIIDLDTCQRGSVLLDLGDAFRSWCRTGEGENCVFDIDLFRSAWQGYSDQIKGLSKIEISYVAQAIKLITLELAARFLTDYFLDFYFSWDPKQYPSRRAHNLIRAKGQVRLFEDECQKEQIMMKFCF
jgi:Ser/Thr protein kinase RdoA (MazF antagonist)